MDARAAEAPAQPGLAVDADAADDMLDAAIAGAIAQPEAARNVDARVMQVQAHRLAARVPCRHCGTLMWPSEGAACCAGGKHILGPAFNPPIDDEYLSMMRQPHFSHDSRLINSALALGSQCTAPSRAMGGLGFHEQHYAHLSLLGTTYLVLRNPHAGNNPFDNYLLPRDLLLETATHDLGAGYAERLLAARAYLHAHHPMACRLRPVADVPAERLDFSSVIRLEANSTHKGAMELAHVSSGVVPKEDSNRVLYFDLRKHEQGGLEPTSVSSFNALFEVLQFPLLFEKGVGGYFYAKGGDAVVSTTGARLTLSDYSRAMVYQNPRLHHMGRLAQEYALVQHSRHVNYLLMYQRNGMLQGNLRRRRDKKAGVAGDGTRVSMSASVVGSRRLCADQGGLGLGAAAGRERRARYAEPAAPGAGGALQDRGRLQAALRVQVCDGVFWRGAALQRGRAAGRLRRVQDPLRPAAPGEHQDPPSLPPSPNATPRSRRSPLRAPSTRRMTCASGRCPCWCTCWTSTGAAAPWAT